jgi:hypothetical protein
MRRGKIKFSDKHRFRTKIYTPDQVFKVSKRNRQAKPDMVTIHPRRQVQNTRQSSNAGNLGAEQLRVHTRKHSFG